jgi:hypothetical protein
MSALYLLGLAANGPTAAERLLQREGLTAESRTTTEQVSDEHA